MVIPGTARAPRRALRKSGPVSAVNGDAEELGLYVRYPRMGTSCSTCG